jgi:hypothetical protein
MINFIGAAGYDPISYPGSWQLVAARGVNGSDGNQGPQGNDGPQGPAGQSAYNWRGTWDYGSYYNQNDVVNYDGSSYVCINGNSNNSPYEGSWLWGLIARRGEQGPQGNSGSDGSQGPQGPAGPGVINWRGAYNYWDYYNTNDAVSSNGSSYICISPHGQVDINNSGYWNLLAQKGTDGSSGGSNPPYSESVWVYNTWYQAQIRNTYDPSWNYYNVLTF